MFNPGTENLMKYPPWEYDSLWTHAVSIYISDMATYVMLNQVLYDSLGGTHTVFSFVLLY